MPTAPTLSPQQMSQQSAMTGINPTMFLLAAAQMQNSGELGDSGPAPKSIVPRGRALQTGKHPPRRLKVLK